MELSSKIYIAGHRGMVGSAILRNLKNKGYNHFVLRSSTELDLRDQKKVERFFQEEKPDYVFLAAAKVGGIHANHTYPADFLYDNVMIQSNVIHSSYRIGVKKLAFLGSSCIYPKFSPQPIKEDALLTGLLEPTNDAYAIAKICGIKLCQAYTKQNGSNFISLMPTNLYGPNDNYDLNNSHVLPALLRKFITAKKEKQSSVILWGTGKPFREFLHVDDLAEASFFLMKHYNQPEIVNIGVGKDISINDLALLIKKVVGYEGAIDYDTSKPDGTPKKQLDVSRLHALGWRHTIELEEGVERVYHEIKDHPF